MARAHYPAATFQEGDGTSLPFSGETFDSVINSIGMPHFADPDAAIGEACRVLGKGGKFAFTVYDAPERSVGFGAVYQAVKEHGTMNVGLPQGPNFFSFQ
ncbi:methyltransferase domain-containing protein [Cyanobium sp. BSA11S]|uniref:class I SAM-dependent methyltransferase n=1 Tax=Cyanobium sp. BSA11S TaxID=3108224 RepID=UPI003D816607